MAFATRRDNSELLQQDIASRFEAKSSNDFNEIETRSYNRILKSFEEYAGNDCDALYVAANRQCLPVEDLREDSNNHNYCIQIICDIPENTRDCESLLCESIFCIGKFKVVSNELPAVAIAWACEGNFDIESSEGCISINVDGSTNTEEWNCDDNKTLVSFACKCARF